MDPKGRRRHCAERYRGLDWLSGSSDFRQKSLERGFRPLGRRQVVPWWGGRDINHLNNRFSGDSMQSNRKQSLLSSLRSTTVTDVFAVSPSRHSRGLEAVYEPLSISTSIAVSRNTVLFDSFELNKVTVAAVGSMSVSDVDDPFQVLCFLSKTTELTPTTIGVHVNSHHTLLANRCCLVRKGSAPLTAVILPGLWTAADGL